MVGTGGNTLAHAISTSNPGYKVVQLSGNSAVEDLKNLKGHMNSEDILFYGHNMFGLLELFGIQEKYITILRNPLDRLISDFFWKEIHNNKETAFNALQKFYSFIQKADHLEFYIHHCGDLRHQNAQHFDLSECSKTANEKAFNMAMDNLKTKFWFVGITEIFDESVYSLLKKLKKIEIGKWWTRRHPFTKYRPQYLELSKTSREIIEKKTKYDLELYQTLRKKSESEFTELKWDRHFIQYFNEAHPI